MSIPLDSQPLQPPPATINQQAYTTRSGDGSVGPVIAVLAVITILGFIAVLIGRICSGRTIFGHGQYDFEGWFESKCSSCIDGRMGPPPSSTINGSSEAISIENPQETKQSEEINQTRPTTSANS